MKTNNRENETQTQNQDNDRVNTETGALIGVELQHGARRATGTSRASGAGTGIAQRLLVVSGSTAAHSSTRTTGGSGRGRAADGGARGDSAGDTSRLGVSTGLGAGGERRGRTRRSLDILLEMDVHR